MICLPPTCPAGLSGGDEPHQPRRAARRADPQAAPAQVQRQRIAELERASAEQAERAAGEYVQLRAALEAHNDDFEVGAGRGVSD